VSFREVSSPRDEKLSLDLSKSMSYDDVCAALADALGVADATTLRLTQHNAYTNAPKTPLAFRGIDALADALPPRSGREAAARPGVDGGAGAGRRAKHDILYYEVLDMPLPALERLKSLRVHFHGKDTRLLDVVNVRVPKESNVADAMAELRRALGEKKVSPSRALRFMETYQSKIFKVFAPDDTIDNINDNYWVLRAEEVPEDEAAFGDSESVAPRGANEGRDDPNSNESGDALICVYHFYRERAAAISGISAVAGEQTNNKESVHLFGDPFFMRVSRDETLGSVKTRARVKLGVAEKAFAEWRWAFHSLGATSEPLADSERVAALFSNTRKDAYGAYESYLGAEHADPSPRKTAAAKRQANAGGFDQRAVKIYG
jgi:ubiquitin carboxyl-terminal hydrolase 7